MRIHCPYHDDKTPSMYCYEEFAHCFVCNAHVPVERVLDGEDISKVKQEAEDVVSRLRIIQELGIDRIRSLSLPRDNEGYYIVWPSGDFYKYRYFGEGQRYKGPKGHKAPVFNLGPDSNTLVVVEGEINALSLAEAFKTRRYAISSPGSCNEMMRHLPFYLTFKSISIIVDKDIPGVANGAALKAELIKRKKRVRLIACEKDINQILQDEGKEGVRRWANEHLGL